jgi:uncharacterized membrane protein
LHSGYANVNNAPLEVYYRQVEIINMEKKLVLVVIAIVPILAGLLWALRPTSVTGQFIGFRDPSPEFVWWNSTWKYRFRLEINSTNYDRSDWPIEYELNFTHLLPEGTFDENSTRVIEYDPSGTVIQQVPSQLDKGQLFNASENAAGTLVFSMDGTTTADSKRIYYVYYDILENGAKSDPDYPVNFDFWWDAASEEFNVNNTAYTFYVDTFRGEGTSGLYRIRGISSGVDIWPTIPNHDQKTYEYQQYSNDTFNFSFDFKNNGTLLYSGPVRLVVEQRGSEVVWNTTTQTGGYMIKRYVFYDNMLWMKVETNYTNVASESLGRNSTLAGALAIDARRIFGANWQSGFGSSQDRWWFASDLLNNFQTGIVLVNMSSPSIFMPNSTGTERIGVSLNYSSIPSGTSLRQTSAIYFDYQADYSYVSALRNRLIDQMNLTTLLPEVRRIVIVPSTDHAVFNRNESMQITADVSGTDPYNITHYINASFDMGTPLSIADDLTVILYDDGTNGDTTANDKMFTGFFNISNIAEPGIWTFNLTAYSEEALGINSTLAYANVTTAFAVGVTVENKNPIGGTMVFADLNVQNFRQDSWEIGTDINCTYFGIHVTNVTDFGNGSYAVNFTAPYAQQVHELFCNATRDGNAGWDNDTFTSESTITDMVTRAVPPNPTVDNISQNGNDSFSITVNSSNQGNGTAYSNNISLELLSGWSSNSTFEQCENVVKNAECLRGFIVTVPQATPVGDYYINATSSWTNPDGTPSTNKTTINVSVLSNPMISVDNDLVQGEMGDGTTEIVGEFTTRSVGNGALSNVTFNCQSGTPCSDFSITFSPSNFSSMAAGWNETVNISVTVPIGYPAGTYTGQVNVSSGNDGYDNFTLRVIVSAKTNMSISNSISTYIAGSVSLTTSESFYFDSNATVIKNGSARFANISLKLPSGWYANSTVEQCGNLTRWQSCVRGFNVTIPNGTTTGVYFVYTYANWTNPDSSLGTNNTAITVTVTSNAIINLSTYDMAANVSDGTRTTIGNFTVFSTGNVPVFGVSFACILGEACQNFTFGFSPPTIASMNPMSSQNVLVNVTVPVTFPSGTYNGTVNATTSNGNSQLLNMSITVPDNRTWSVAPTSCERSLQEPEGTVCEVNVTNNGNTYINFTVGPASGNYTQLNETGFSVSRSGMHAFKITYNTTGILEAVYNSTFAINATQSDSTPAYSVVQAALVPYIPPIINIALNATATAQNSSIIVQVNVTDRSGSGISYVRANISKPGGSVESVDLSYVGTNGTTTSWEMTYPNSTNVSLIERGTYNVTIFALDNIGNLGSESEIFRTYLAIRPSLSTMSDRYYQGDTGQIYFVSHNLTGSAVQNVTVNFTLRNAQGNVTYASGSMNTDSDGVAMPLPSFTIYSDSPTGTFVMTARWSYFDAVAGWTVSNETNYSFQVVSRTVSVTGLFVDLDTAVVWYPPLPGYDTPQIRFGILTYNAEGKPVDPDSINITVYRPNGSVYMTHTMDIMVKVATGYYTFNQTMDSDTPAGMYLAVVNATQGDFTTQRLKAFRVSRGGPYDVSITPLENEVEQGTPLDFIITIDNKGEVSQDVALQYWVEAQGTTYYDRSEAVLTPALTASTFTRTASIASDQPLGNYYLHAKVSYDNTQPPIEVNTSFVVVARSHATTTIPAPIYITYNPGGIPSGQAPLPSPNLTNSGLAISRYTSNISLAVGLSSIEVVTVENTGNTKLENLSVAFIGLPVGWFNISPSTYREVQIGNSSVFLLLFSVPANANAGTYSATLIATSGVLSDQKAVSVTIFESTEALLRKQLIDIRDQFLNLQVDTKAAELEGRDISTVTPVINDIKGQLDLAESNLNSKDTKSAMANIANARNLLEKGRGILNKLLSEMPKAPAIPIYVWIIAIVVIVVLGVVVILIRRRSKEGSSKPWMMPLRKLVEDIVSRGAGIGGGAGDASGSGGASATMGSSFGGGASDVSGERDRLIRMLEVLEKEKNDRIISQGAYREMKASIEEKLRKIEDRMFRK